MSDRKEAILKEAIDIGRRHDHLIEMIKRMDEPEPEAATRDGRKDPPPDIPPSQP